jgi:hypothetical protein
MCFASRRTVSSGSSKLSALRNADSSSAAARGNCRVSSCSLAARGPTTQGVVIATPSSAWYLSARCAAAFNLGSELCPSAQSCPCTETTMRGRCSCATFLSRELSFRRHSDDVTRLPCRQRHSVHHRFRCVALCQSTQIVEGFALPLHLVARILAQ